MKSWQAIAIILILHVVGWLGLSSSYASYFLLLTPVNLLISAFLALKFQPKFSTPLILLLLVSFLLGFFAEMLGVQTGYLFGNYSYGSAMGPKLWGVPLTIGLNWMILTYCSAEIVQKFMKPSIVRPIVGASLLLLFDYMLEPAAIKLGYWSWEGGTIPFFNYATWFAIGFILHLFYEKYHKGSNNHVAMWLFLIQILFFIGIQSNFKLDL